MKNYKSLFKIFFLVFLLAVGFIYADSALGSRLGIRGMCVDDDFRIMKNGKVVYNGKGVAKCAIRDVKIKAGCDDEIKIQLKDNYQIEVGFSKIILSYNGRTQAYRRWYYLGNKIIGKRGSYYPTVRLYNTEVSGTLRDLNLCPKSPPDLSVSCHASPKSIKTGESSTFVSSVSGGTGSYDYSWSGACSGTGSDCHRAFSSSGNHKATVSVTSGSQSQSASCSVSVEQGCTSHDYKACYGGDVYWYDSCGNREEKYDDCGYNETCQNGACVADCTDHDHKACYGGDVYWYDSCGNREEKYDDCGYNETCENGACVTDCTDHDHRACYGGDVYWYDSCGNREEKYDDCGYNESCNNGVCVRDDDLYITCDTYPDPAEIGEEVTFSVSASGGSGYYYSYEWHGDCYDYHSSTCEEKFYSPGTYSATVTVRSGNDSKTATCSVRVDDDEEDHLACYHDDVYWYDADGHRLNKYEDCGSDYCEDDGDNYCYNGDVYEEITCYEKGCSNGSCYSDTRTERELVERCDSDETCSNGRCVSECECSSGPCCDGCYYKSDDTVCDVSTQTQYGCPWGTGCGADVGKRTKSRFKYCSGQSSQCTGEWSDWDWGNWQVSDYCTYAETCYSGSPSCQYNSSCVTPQQTYYAHYTKGCYQDDMYWYDSNGGRQDKYRECSDDNECTLDGCSNGVCFNNLKCDGSTCQEGSEDYCEACEHCGDGSCNCGENSCSCFEDCLGLVFSMLVKNAEGQNRWQESIKTDAGEEIYFLMNITNSGPEDLDRVTVKATLPPEIDYDNELTMEGNSLSGNIERGVGIGFLPSNTTRTISFQGKALKDLETSQQVEVIGEVSVNDSSASDYAEIDIAVKGRTSAAAGLIFSSDLFKRWYFWLLILPVALAILFFISKKVFSFSRS